MTTVQDVHQEDSPREALSHFQKMNLANAARLMADSQSQLNLTNQRANLFLKHEAAMLGQKPEAKDDDMQIAIDSPTTHNHYHPKPAEAAPVSVMSPLMKLAAVGLLASGIGVPAGIAAWNLPSILGSKPAAVATQPSGNLLQDYDLFVGSPPAKDAK